MKNAEVEVHLTEVTHPEAVQLMVDFLYEVTDEAAYAPTSGDVNADVLRLAERFLLQGLKRRAAVFLAKGVNTHNAVDALKQCKEFGLHDLKDRILDQLALSNKALAEVTSGSAISSHPQLLQEILK